MTEEELLFKYKHGRTIDKEDIDNVVNSLSKIYGPYESIDEY